MVISIVDDNVQFQETIAVFLEQHAGFKNINNYKSVRELLLSDFSVANHIILMDIEMPEMNGIEGTKQLLWENRELKIIAITYHHEKLLLEELIRTGFKGCVSKNNVFEQLETAINKVHNNQIYFPEYIRY